jgi:hypothetical protein
MPVQPASDIRNASVYVINKINRCATFTSLHTLTTHTHFLFCQTVSSIDNVCRWCSTNRKLPTILALHSNARTTRRVKGFVSGLSYTTPSCYSAQCCHRQQTRSPDVENAVWKFRSLALITKKLYKFKISDDKKQHPVECANAPLR